MKITIQTDLKGADIHFSVYVNHKLAGKLALQADEYDEFIARIHPDDIRDGAISLNAEYYAAAGRGNAYRKLHESRNTSRSR